MITVPAHRHDVQLDFVRYEFMAAHRLGERHDAWLRIPYDVKKRTASIELVDPATPAEIAAMNRNLAIHHPTETLENFSDASLLVARKTKDAWRDGDLVIVAFGTSLPIGKTEKNPYALGDAGLPHEHIQFGTGTFDPLLELYYVAPVSEHVSVSANAIGRFPLYENGKHYQGPIEVSSGLNVSTAVTERIGLLVGWSGFYQGYAHWEGERDDNSGIVSHAVVGGASYAIADGVVLRLAARVPTSQNTLSSDGDVFEQGTVVQLGMSYSFGAR